MDSFFARNRLSAYLDGALPPAEAREVASAIERDPELSAEYEALRKTVALLQQEGPAKAPAGFHARVMGKLAEEQPPAGNVVRLRRWVARLPVEAVALAAAAAVVVVAIQWQPAPEPEAVDAGERTAAAAPDEAAHRKDAPAPAEKAEAAKQADAGVQAEAAGPEEGNAPPVEEQAQRVVADAAAPPPAKNRTVPPAQQATQEYVPEWEAPEAPAVAAVRGMSLRVSNDQVLHQLEQLARRVDGQLSDGQGRAMRPFELSAEAPTTAVLLVVPAHRASEIQSQLQGFGARAGTAPSGLMVGNGNAGFYIDVRYVGAESP